MRGGGRRRGTICFDLPVAALDDFAEVRPFGEVVEVEANVVGFGQVVEVAGVEFEEVGWGHGADIGRRGGGGGGHVDCCCLLSPSKFALLRMGLRDIQG